MSAAAANERGEAHYGPELARIHHDHFGTVARAAARELLGRLSSRGIAAGRVCDLAAGTGILSRTMIEAGFDVLGVDLSNDMLQVARGEVPEASFVQASLWDAELPACVAVAAVGEAFSYAADRRASLSLLEGRLLSIHRGLKPGGLLLFDVAAPGRSGPTGTRRAFWSGDGAYLGLEEYEDRTLERLSRTITIFLRSGQLYRKVVETHALQLYQPEQIERLLSRCGFEWERLSAYADFPLLPGWHAFFATKKAEKAPA
jgi:SAM-dependent methyltransferase